MDSVHPEGILQILNPLTFLEHQLGSWGEGVWEAGALRTSVGV